MLKPLKKNNKGFTIIEVMIVLAIAGLILLIVFLAVPGLQRNQRNTQRKNDISNMLGVVSEYEANHNGALPALTDVLSGAKMSYYSGSGTGQGQVTLVASGATGQPALAPTAPNDRVVIVTGGVCDTATAGKVNQGSARQIAVQYLVEKSGGYDATCQDS